MTATATANDEGRPARTALDDQQHQPQDTDQDGAGPAPDPFAIVWTPGQDPTPAKDDARPEPPAGSFTAWLLQRQDHPEGKIGHLAQEVAQDPDWPVEVQDLDNALDYLQRHGANYDGERALIYAWDVYEREHDARPAQLDLDQVRAWIELAYPRVNLDEAGVLHVSATDAWSGRRFKLRDLDDLLAYVAQLDREGRAGIYLRATTMDPKAGKGRGKAADSVELVGLWSDIDLDGPGHKHDPAKYDGLVLPPDEVAGRAIVDRAGLPVPSVWIHSGGGLYAWWLLDFPEDLTEEEDRKDAGRIVADLQDLLALAAKQAGHHYGTGVKDLARVLRIPGTVNRKTETGRPCRIVDQIADR
jgi:uncharacterized protein YozE (UPF0346 family)